MMIAGFVYGVVMDDEDPQGLGQIRVMVPSLFPEGTPYWCRPGGWPGAGSLDFGSQYPAPPKNAQVALVFEFGDPEAGAVYFPMMYGLKNDGTVGGPTAVAEVDGAAKRNKRVVLWDDSIFSMHVTLDGDGLGRIFTIVDKEAESGTSITIDARDGDGTSKSVSIKARTAVYITCDGGIKIEGSPVTINGRTVMHGGGSI